MRALAIGVSSLLLMGCGDNLAASGEVDVSATAFDPDRGETVSFSWSPAAQFANPSSAVTSYLCPAAGRQTLSLSIADSRRPTPCTARATLQVDCVAATGARP